MKNMMMILIATILGSATTAKAASALVEHRAQLIEALKNDSVVGTTIKDAESKGEHCEIDVREIKRWNGLLKFKAQVNCGIEADEVTGGGIVLMISVEGVSYGDFLDQLKLFVQRAG